VWVDFGADGQFFLVDKQSEDLGMLLSAGSLLNAFMYE
jgi:hypothetical protein